MSAQNNPSYQGYAPPQGAPPQRNENAGLPQGQERAEQMEYMQSFEANTQQSEDDVNQATLCREFPKLDSSLIAAIYNDTKSMGATREMLMELNEQTEQGS